MPQTMVPVLLAQPKDNSSFAFGLRYTFHPLQLDPLSVTPSTPARTFVEHITNTMYHGSKIVQSFFVADGKVWVRNYQIVDKGDGSSSALNRKIERGGGGGPGTGDSGGGVDDPLSLVEMGPRFVLNPIRVFAGSFGGPTLYNNAAYVSPNAVRSAKKRKAGFKFEDRQDAKKVIRGKKAEPAVPRGPLHDVFSG